MPSAGSTMYLSVSLNSLIFQSIKINVEAFVSLCIRQFSHVLPLPVAGAILSLSQFRIPFLPTLFYLLVILKTWINGVYILEARSDQSNIILGMLRRLA